MKSDELDGLKRENTELRATAKAQKAELDRLQALRKTPREKVSQDQIQLVFADADARLLTAIEPSDAPDAVPVEPKPKPDGDGPSDEPKKRSRRRHPHGRQILPEHLPTETVVLEPRCGLEAGRCIREEESYRLGYRPASYVRIRVVRPVMSVIDENSGSEADGSAAAELRTVECAPMPPEMIERGLPGCSMLAHVVVAKYLDRTPLHRLQGIMARQDLNLTRGTMVRWLNICHDLTSTLVDEWFADAMKHSHIIGTDATGILVQQKHRYRRGHVWVFVADAGYVLYRYSARHTSEEPLGYFKHVRGVGQADAAPVFDQTFAREDGPTEAGCWSHARRYFIRAMTSHGELALVGIGYCNRPFEFDRAMADMTSERRLEERPRASRPVVEHLYAWLESLEASGKLETGSLIAKAATYFVNQRKPLSTFLTDGRVRLDNNPSELNLRNVVVGRANWIFVGGDEGGKRHVAYLSIVMSAKNAGLEPQTYVRDLFRVLPHWPKSRLVELAPHRWLETRVRLDPDRLGMELGPLDIPARSSGLVLVSS